MRYLICLVLLLATSLALPPQHALFPRVYEVPDVIARRQLFGVQSLEPRGLFSSPPFVPLIDSIYQFRLRYPPKKSRDAVMKSFTPRTGSQQTVPISTTDFLYIANGKSRTDEVKVHFRNGNIYGVNWLQVESQPQSITEVPNLFDFLHLALGRQYKTDAAGKTFKPVDQALITQLLAENCETLNAP